MAYTDVYVIAFVIGEVPIKREIQHFVIFKKIVNFRLSRLRFLAALVQCSPMLINVAS